MLVCARLRHVVGTQWGSKKYNEAKKAGDAAGMAKAEKELKPDYKYFGYGYFNDVKEAIPDVAMVFYPFHIMVAVGGWLLVFLAATVFLSFKRRGWLSCRWKKISVFPLLAFVPCIFGI